MTFFYDLNKRLATLAAKQDATQIAESKQADHVAQSPLTQALNEAKADTIYVQHSNGAPQKVKLTPDMKAAGKIYVQHPSGPQTKVKIPADAKKSVKEEDVAEAGYSAKAGRAGKDLGKPGKMFSKIAKSAGKEYGSKAAGERVAGAVLNKLRGKTNEADMEEGNEFSGELAKAKATGAKEFKVDGKSYPVKETEMTPKQKSFAKLAPPTDKVTFADKIAGAKKEVDEMLGDVAAEAIKKAVKKSEPRSKGTAFDPEVAKTMTSTDSHPRYDVKDTGYSKRYTRKVQDEPTDDAEVSTEPKKKGRPKGPEKGPERVTAKSYKYKSGRPAKVAENDLATVDRGEYDREGDMAKEQMHTIMSAAKELHSMLKDEENLPEWVQKKITLAKEYIDTARDYMVTQHAERAEEEPIAEKAVSKKQQRFMGMVHAAQKGEKPGSKEVAKAAKSMGKKDAKDFAATKHKGLPEKVKEEGTDKEDQHAERAGKKVTKDLEYDMKHKGKDDAKAERAGKKVTKDLEYDDKKDKEKKVAETSKGGYNFGGGVYESLDRKFQQALTEGMNVSVNMSTGQDGNPTKNITISADGEDADRLAELLKMAGLSGHGEESCQSCGQTPCGCESLDENSPDWPTNTETSDDAMQYSGGLNGPKSTGQTTVPVIASQLRRQVSMEESVKLENDLFKLYQNYKAQ
jgi:hypothetical protein